MISIEKKITNKKMHSWANENNTASCWILNKKLFWQSGNEPNGTYKVTSDFMVTFNGLLIMSKTAFEVFDKYLDATVFVTTHGVINKEPNTDADWQMYRR